MEAPHTWRELLKRLIKNPSQKAWLVQQLGINAHTLSRWANGVSSPRSQHLHQLLAALPEYTDVLHASLSKEFPTLAKRIPIHEDEGDRLPDKAAQGIAPAFYAEVLGMIAVRPQAHIWPIRKLILQHALEQIDPQQKRVIITLAQCVSPSRGNKVRSLQVVMGLGQPAWGGDLDQQPIFLGAESIAGRVASFGHPLTIQNLQETWMMPAPGRKGLASLSTHPLRRAGRIVGTFTVISSQPEYFLPSRLTLIQQYTNLIAITFTPEDFYALEDIELDLMPPPPMQEPYLGSFRQRVLHVMREAANNRQPMTTALAERVVWQQVEEELSHLALLTEK